MECILQVIEEKNIATILDSKQMERTDVALKNLALQDFNSHLQIAFALC